MATEGGSNNGLALIVGALVVIVAILAYFYMGGEAPDAGGSPDVTIELPAGDK
ncbi:hypothetical protein CLV77_1772 [Brevirhabdus pacifica]|uniref:hypothetical protein n=1 Tax=Brevirhabdus pacifica TaxID=1267768 RepID=UPI000CB43FEE|nr:hypothetical protein [Brevirhabdus pacifica]PJJ87205.1 hypothetical protein CLV77_1772 [Brevirhabdus pacifica]